VRVRARPGGAGVGAQAGRCRIHGRGRRFGRRPDPVTEVFVGLGSNLGDRLASLRRAVDLLAGGDAVRVVAVSRVYETAPVGPPQPDYLNAVAEVRTSLGARELLGRCLAVESEMGRIRAERWGPRIIDLD